MEQSASYLYWSNERTRRHQVGGHWIECVGGGRPDRAGLVRKWRGPGTGVRAAGEPQGCSDSLVGCVTSKGARSRLGGIFPWLVCTINVNRER